MRKIELDEYKKITLSILVKIDEICRKNNINYFLFAGTLLGAVRHNGYIPWDDDVDICILRADYDRLAKIIQNGDYGLNFIRIEEHQDSIYPFGKICDTNTMMIEKNFKTVNGYGAFVDVFPLDYMPDDDKMMLKQGKKYFRKYQMLTHSARTAYEKTNSKITNIKRCAAFYISRIMNSEKLVRKINAEFIAMNERTTNHVGLGWYKAAWLAEDFLETSEVVFEGYKFLAPKNPDRVLRMQFGNYMKLPPENQREPKHQLLCYYKNDA